MKKLLIKRLEQINQQINFLKKLDMVDLFKKKFENNVKNIFFEKKGIEKKLKELN